MSVEVFSQKIDIFLAMIQAGNGWYAMAVGLGVVFTSLILVSVVITITGAFFRRRMQRLHPSPPTQDVPSRERESGAVEETDLVAAAVAVALALHGARRPRGRRPAPVRSDDGDPWRLSGRAALHSRSQGSR